MTKTSSVILAASLGFLGVVVLIKLRKQIQSKKSTSDFEHLFLEEESEYNDIELNALL
ncbi:hypothetical protein [Riemerella columbipharyngis]|uniref:Uncharacterized protein n=1 Tax=Riemerella columbipharyngis TaxID=1071918 RepID=A0A1G6ZR15_9FLAO|nr:hypothetical protein [Riemerella columbipharyngis]SDE04813.1 hypothetical protein SAMN05421544_102170 [Riemerella columbipharyngis]